MQQLVLLHGALGHPKQFDPIIPELEKHFEVYELLFSGHGGSPLPETGISMEGLVEQLHGFFEERKLECPHVFGYSMGGYVALCHALKYPSRIRSILTLATKFDWTVEISQKEAKMLVPESIEEKVAAFAKQLASLHGAKKWKNLVRATADMMLDLGENPRLSEKDCKQLSIPIQLMVGDGDKMVGIEETLKVGNQIPDSRFAVLPHTIHPLEKVRPGLLLDLMKDFWDMGSK